MLWEHEVAGSIPATPTTSTASPRGASIGSVERVTISGPVGARAEIDIAAGQRVVWSVLADIDAWATWNPAVRESSLNDELEVGARFRYATALGSMRCRLVSIDAPSRLAWSTRVLTMGHQQVFELDGSVDACHVAGEATLSGPGAWLFKSRLDERLRADLDATLQLLRLEAETRAAEELEDEARGIRP